MRDPRIVKMARVLIDYSADIQPGDRILLEAEPTAEPLLRELFLRTLERGGHPLLMVNLAGQVTYSGIDDLFLRHAEDSQIDFINPFYKMAYEE